MGSQRVRHDWATELNWSHSFKSCALPSSLLFRALPEPHPGPQICIYNLLEGHRENSWPLGGKYCIISNHSRNSGLHLPCFPQHVWQQNLSLDPLEWVTDTQSLLEAHLLVPSFQGQLSFQGQCLPLWELALQAIWTKALTTLILKLQTYPWIKSPLHFYGTSGPLPLINLFLSQLLTPTTRNPAPL